MNQSSTSKRMAAVRSRDTAPELHLRQALHARGLRFRVHPNDVPGRPDIVNRSRKVAIFVDGDFWHGNPAIWTRRGMSSMEDLFPPEKRSFWTQKLTRNMERDREVDSALSERGWKIIRVWASEVLTDTHRVATRVTKAWHDRSS